MAEILSGIILAGGLSSRMGSCKARLPWEGTDLVRHQVRKLQALGITDILLSGFSDPVEGTRFVADVYPRLGPMGGIHAGLLAARQEQCLVTAVDTPLVPPDALSGLVRYHLDSGNDITVLSHNGHLEPLMGVYHRRVAPIAEALLRERNTAVRRLFDRVTFAPFPYTGDEQLLCDCNTRQDYARACAIRSSRP